jgi:hypothetical protein
MYKHRVWTECCDGIHMVLRETRRMNGQSLRVVVGGKKYIVW